MEKRNGIKSQDMDRATKANAIKNKNAMIQAMMNKT